MLTQIIRIFNERFPYIYVIYILFLVSYFCYLCGVDTRSYNKKNYYLVVEESPKILIFKIVLYFYIMHNYVYKFFSIFNIMDVLFEYIIL